MRNDYVTPGDLENILIERVHVMKDFLKESPYKLSRQAVTQLNLILLTLDDSILRELDFNSL